MIRNMLAKYSGRGAREFSTVSSSSSSTLKRVWDELSTFRLFLAFTGGFLGWSLMNLYKRKMLSEKICRMRDEHVEYSDEVWDRVIRFHRGEYGEKPTLDSYKIPRRGRKKNSGPPL